MSESQQINMEEFERFIEQSNLSYQDSLTWIKNENPTE